MDGPEILVASMSVPTPRGKTRALWQYHSRSDHHSKVGCWGVLFDLLQQSRVLRGHAHSGKVIFGVNFSMVDHVNGRAKKLDLVIARPSSNVTKSKPKTLEALATEWSVVLTPAQHAKLANLPALYSGPVGAVLVALEAKAAMTAFTKAKPRLYDELNSSHSTVHGASTNALAVGLALINAGSTFVSPIINKDSPTTGKPVVLSKHSQPGDALGAIAKVREIRRRTTPQGEGYDGLGVVVVDAINDGVTPVRLVLGAPAPQTSDVLHYETMITRVANEYDASFRGI